MVNREIIYITKLTTNKVRNCLATTRHSKFFYNLKSSGDLSNNDEVARIALKLAYTAAKIPVNPDIKDSFKRISSKY